MAFENEIATQMNANKK
uniref:Uncharacterized protein n=1 Tax=Anguilla anguilla TaxID=7936 RepID=A0A0E9V465_ANGAN